VREVPSGEARRRGILWLILTVYLVCCASLAIISYLQSDRHVIYPLDDAYIHMDLAKNLAKHGVFGVTAYESTYCASSPLWIFLLAAIYSVSGVSVWVSLALNLVAGCALSAMTAELLIRRGASSGVTGFVGLAMIVFAALPTMALSGMEHTLHIVVAVAFVVLAAQILEERKATTRWANIAILPLTCRSADAL